VPKDDAASPAASLECILLTSIVDVKENREVMSTDISNACTQANMPKMTDGKERIIVKISGVLVKLLIEIDPNNYGPFLVSEKV
jgi:hypothetical protein